MTPIMTKLMVGLGLGMAAITSAEAGPAVSPAAKTFDAPIVLTHGTKYDDKRYSNHRYDNRAPRPFLWSGQEGNHYRGYVPHRGRSGWHWHAVNRNFGYWEWIGPRHHITRAPARPAHGYRFARGHGGYDRYDHHDRRDGPDLAVRIDRDGFAIVVGR